MFLADASVKEIFEVKPQIHKITLITPETARITEPGQFVNVRVSETHYPLLRRPFSICDASGETITLLFNLYGEGTRMLAHLKPGDSVNLIGPLGNGFKSDKNIKIHIFVAGGMGVAPFPLLRKRVEGDVHTFIGGRSSREIIELDLPNREIATEDGSLGFKGNVVELLERKLGGKELRDVMFYGCGPTAMLRSLKEFCLKHKFPCQVSTECAMACGFGICQGCPIESSAEPGNYKLVCKDGPVFNIEDIIL